MSDLADFALTQTLLSRQPIVDRQEVLVGYEISLQGGAEGAKANQAEDEKEAKDAKDACRLSDSLRAPMLVSAAYAELGIRSALGRNVAYLRISADFLHDDAIEALPPDAVVLELAFADAPDARTLERCRALRDRRYSLGLADYAGLDERSTPLLNLVDVVVVDIRAHDLARLSDLVGPLAHLPLRLMAQGVETQAALAHCRSIGFHLFQGHCFARPEIVSGRRLSASQGALIQLINLAGRDVDTARIEDAIKREPALAVNLLRIVNSVGFGAVRRIASLRHAITLLGRRQLQRWLQLLLMAPAGSSPDLGRSPLLQVAALRGRMMEILIETSRPGNRELADLSFITGIMSMMPLALGLPLAEIFEQITLDTEVVQALSGHAGVLGETLALIECFDAEDAAGCERLLAQETLSGVDYGVLNACLIESLRWVNGGDE